MTIVLSHDSWYFASLIIALFVQTKGNQDFTVESVKVNGHLIRLKNLTLKECKTANDAMECMWCDSNHSHIIPADSASDLWTGSENGWKSSCSHDPYDISDAINNEETGDLQDLPNQREHDAKMFIHQLPFFLLGDPKDKTRRLHTQSLLRSIGLTMNLSSPLYTRAEDIDIEELKASNRIDQAAIDRMVASDFIGTRALKQYIANVIDHLHAIKMGIEGRYKLFSIFEDDIMLAGSPLTVGLKIKSALKRFPPSADMLYLEGCHEICSERRFSVLYPLWARTTGPTCSAAIVITRKGARRISALCGSIFWGIDNMYSAMIRAGLLEAYVITPAAFFQDGYWSSSVQSLRGSRPRRKYGDRARAGVTHRPFAIVCHEMREELRLVHVQISDESEYLRRCFAAPSAAPSKFLLIADTLTNDPEADEDKDTITYYTPSAVNNSEWIEVGKWPQNLPAKLDLVGVILWLDQSSACFETMESGRCRLKIDSRYGTGHKSSAYAEIGEMLAVPHQIESEADIMLHSFRISRETCRRENYGSEEMPQTEQPPGPKQHVGLVEATDEVDVVRAGADTDHNGILSEDLDELSRSESDADTQAQCDQPLDSLLTGVHFIFDGIMYRYYAGKMSGINKMWYNIVPFMADVVHRLNGTFTHCQSSWDSEEGPKVVDIPRVSNLRGCEDLGQVISGLPGHRKIVFSSYYRIANLSGDERVCNILPLYDFIPERMNVYERQHFAFYSKAANIPLASAFFSNSNSTTADLDDLHGFYSEFVSTSPMRVSKTYRRVSTDAAVEFEEDFERSEELRAFLNSNRRFLLLVGYSVHSPEYKGYDLFWAALLEMPADFRSEMSLLIIGGLPAHQVELSTLEHCPDVPEGVLPILYSRAAALVYPSRYEGFGMPPIEAVACGCPVILGSFYSAKMRHVYGDDALYAGDAAQMRDALLAVHRGQVPPPEALVARASRYGGDGRYGWNEVAKEYLLYMLRGPFLETAVSRCEEAASPACLDALRVETTDGGIAVAWPGAPQEPSQRGRR